MSTDAITALATAITAIGALALIAVTLWVEYSRRRNERGQFHVQQLRELVCQPLRNQIIRHYLPILERQDCMIRLDTHELSAKYDPLQGRNIEWALHLAIKSPSPSPGWTVGEHQAFVDYDATFPHLYRDAKLNHFPELFQKWEEFVGRMNQLGEKSMELCQTWRPILEKHIGLPSRCDQSTPRPWANYDALSFYLYTQLWWRYPNNAGSFQESGYWTLRFDNVHLVEGQQDDVIVCLKRLGALTRTELISDLLQVGDQLKQEAITLKGQIEQLILTQLILEPCPFVRVPRL